MSFIQKIFNFKCDYNFSYIGIKVFAVIAILWFLKQVYFHSKIEMHRLKIDTEGRYKPFYGYTIIAMCDITPKLAALNEVFKTSRIAKYCQPLPLDSYHVTVYDIWHEKTKLYSYQLELANGIEQVKDLNVMNQLMKPALDKMNEKINTYSNIDKIKLKILHLNPGHNALSIRVSIEDEEQNSKIKNFRKWCGKEFHKTRPGLIFHVTLGYYFREKPSHFNEDISLLQRWINENLKEIVIKKPHPMFFRTMEKFIPYEQAF